MFNSYIKKRIDKNLSNYKKVVVLNSYNDFDDTEYEIANCGKLRKIYFQIKIPLGYLIIIQLPEINIFLKYAK